MTDKLKYEPPAPSPDPHFKLDTRAADHWYQQLVKCHTQGRWDEAKNYARAIAREFTMFAEQYEAKEKGEI